MPKLETQINKQKKATWGVGWGRELNWGKKTLKNDHSYPLQNKILHSSSTQQVAIERKTRDKKS